MEIDLMQDSIQSSRAELDIKTREAYYLHLKLAKEYPLQFDHFLKKIKTTETFERKKKSITHSHKVKSLKTKITPTPKPTVKKVENFVVNQSTQQFIEDQLKLLNNGLKHAINENPNIEQLIVDIESAIRTSTKEFPLSLEDQSAIRNLTASVIESTNTQPKRINKDQKVLKELKRKPVYYIKADKGNALVIMDKDEYDQRVQEKIDNGPYREFRINPLPEMVNRTNKLVEKCSKFLEFDKKQMKEPAPSLPRFKALPKIHKPEKEMREIITADRSPCQRIAKWLVKELTCILGSSHSFSVKNSKEFAEKLKLENITGDEETVSFDVKALYPSVN
ncbi:uncharacterized protein LOC119665014, partial [Teleopsis dalmanni]|uniref:uncharacterized protein LOC119665014 n=1 Tax=Teleopsis dalmanni TaxID=139649 RepID=UPI0018CF63CD